MKNKKGFTLVELLAVIVILAVIMLVAITSIGPMMANSRKSALGTEGIALIKSATTAYNAEGLKGSNAEFTSTSTVCMSLKYLNKKGYFEKSIADGYDGSVLVVYDSAQHKNEFIFWLTNGTYMYLGVGQDEIDPDNAIDYDADIASKIDSCPNVTSIPTVNISGSTFEEYGDTEPNTVCKTDNCGIPTVTRCSSTGYEEIIDGSEVRTTTTPCKSNEYCTATGSCVSGKQNYICYYYKGGTLNTTAERSRPCTSKDTYANYEFTDAIFDYRYYNCEKIYIYMCQPQAQPDSFCQTEKGLVYRNYLTVAACGYEDKGIRLPDMEI